MTLSNFISLNREDRYIMWLSKAIEVASYEKGGVLHILYQLDNFYIEISLLTAFPQLVIFIAFVDGTRLTPYLDRIDITELCQ